MPNLYPQLTELDLLSCAFYSFGTVKRQPHTPVEKDLNLPHARALRPPEFSGVYCEFPSHVAREISVKMTLNVSTALQELSQRAARYSINLDDRVDRDVTQRPLRGGNAFVYQGTLRPNGLKVAVKTIRSGPPEEMDFIKYVLREVYVWSKLRHKNVARLLGITTKFDHTISIVSEWMGTGNAHHYVKDRNVDPRPLIVEIAKGLHYLHNHDLCPIYHGDLKGANVLISHDGHALLTDFGISYLVKSSFSMSLNVPRGGTINWLSPENLDDLRISAESDIWAFGMTALELFTRATPFHEVKNLTAIISRIMTRPPDRPSDENTCSRMSDDWWSICRRCWDYEPSSRPSIETILNEIEQKIDQYCPVSGYHPVSGSPSNTSSDADGIIEDVMSTARGRPIIDRTIRA